MTSNAQIIACSKSITIHSLESRQPISNFTHHRGIVNSVSINHNNKVIASCGQDGKIFLVNAEKPQSKLAEHSFYANFKEKPSSLSVCAFSPNSKFLAVGSVDSVVKLWDLRAEKNQKDHAPLQIKSHMGAITSFAWLKNIRGEAYGSENLASASSSGDIFIHSNKGGEFIQANYLKMHEGINCIRSSQSFDYCRLAACTIGGTLSIWDMMANKEKPFWTTAVSAQNKASITSLSFSPFSSVLLVTSSVDQSLIFYDIHQKKSVKKILTEQPLSSVGLHQNGHVLIAGGMYGSIFVYDLRFPSKPQNKLIGHQTSIKHLQFYKQKQGSENKLNKLPLNTESKSLPVQDQQKAKESNKIPQVADNNFINIQKPIQLQKSKQNIVQPKIPRASQQIIKSSIPKKPEALSQFKQSADSDFYRNRSKQSRDSIGSEGDNEGLKKQVKQLKQMLTSLKNSQKQMKNQIYEMEQRMNYSMIKQFQLHQQQMTKIMQTLLNRDQQRDKLIKKLQDQNNKLKNSTF